MVENHRKDSFFETTKFSLKFCLAYVTVNKWNQQYLIIIDMEEESVDIFYILPKKTNRSCHLLLVVYICNTLS